MWTRRSFLRTTGVVGTTALAWRRVPGLEAIVEASAAVAAQSPADAARDEIYWGQIQQAFAVDRTMINLNTGHHCSQPTVVLDAVKRYLDMENLAPVYYAGLINRNGETVRRELAGEFGCDPEEMAITRNASESLQILQNGLDLAAGDEVITTEQDYPRMLTTWDQRMRRDKIKVTRLQFPVPTTGQTICTTLFEKAITPKTKVLHFCHITNLTGQLFPVQRICRMARARGITTIVDGAHAGAQFPFKLHDLECDAYGVSLHKWLLAPFGTGILFVRARPDSEVLAAAGRAGAQRQRHPQVRGDRHGAGGDTRRDRRRARVPSSHRCGAQGRALVLPDDALGESPASPCRRSGCTRACSRARPGAWRPSGSTAWRRRRSRRSSGTSTASSSRRWRKATCPRQQFDYQGVRVTPNVYTTLGEVDTFARAMEELAKTPPGEVDAAKMRHPRNEP